MTSLTVETLVNADLECVWECWTQPKHITQWNFASPEWHCPRAENDLRPGGTFSYRMEAKNGSMGFDYAGKYSEVVPYSAIEYRLEDTRKGNFTFKKEGNTVKIVETFEVDDTHTLEQQRMGWQAILNTFMEYTENKQHNP